MSEELQSQIDTYNIQLQQVDAALTSDPTNEELLKLKNDLREVLNLTQELLLPQQGSSRSSNRNNGWKKGDKCLAPWVEDGVSYEAVVQEPPQDGKVKVLFSGYGNVEIIDLLSLKPISGTSGKPSDLNDGTNGQGKKAGSKDTILSKKQAITKHKEYLKKRKIKKLARFQELETEREKDKKKWLSFSTKKGLMNKKKSIFASPESVDGRVGIGTCGVSGKPMTEFSAAEKWRKGWRN